MARSVGAGEKRGDSSRRRSPVPPPSGQPSGGPRKFVQESWAELKKVQWPTFPHLAHGTLVVGIVTLFFAVYLTLVDQLVVQVIKLITPS